MEWFRDITDFAADLVTCVSGLAAVLGLFKKIY